MNEEVRNIWNANAGFWDNRMGEGNDFHRILIEPVQLRLLNIKTGDKILDIACGNGQFARKMHDVGAKIIAVDFSEKFITIARAKSSPDIEYRVLDATRADDFDTLPPQYFNAVVCTMALMDMSDIGILFGHLPKLLKPNGIFVFSILHPCFNSGETVLVNEQDEADGKINNRYAVKISNYLMEKSCLGIGMSGQPKPQYYFHRPLSVILKKLFENGFVLDALEEPSFSNPENRKSIYDNVFRYKPPALICRLRITE